MNYQLSPARAFSSASIAYAVTRGFEGYPVRIAPSAWDFEAKAASDDLNLEVSQIATVDEKIAGVALLGVRETRGWIGGLGVAPEYRRGGMGRALTETVIAQARQLGLQEITLEVLQSNQAAIALYRHLGFEIESELLTWKRPVLAGPLPPPTQQPQVIDLDEALSYWHWHPLSPHWQREPQSLRRRMRRWGEHAQVRAVFNDEDQVSGYALLAVQQADFLHEAEVRLLDMAVDPKSGIRGPGRALLQGLHNEFRDLAFQIVNVPADDDTSILLAALNYQVTFRQWGMKLDVRDA